MENTKCTFYNLKDTHLGIDNQFYCQHCEQISNLANRKILKDGIVAYVTKT